MARLILAITGALSCLAVACPSASPALAQSPEEFYRGKTLQILVGNPPGTGFDLYARTLAPHLARALPGNPAVVVSNMPGASGLRLAQHLSSAAPRDGTAIATLNPNLLSLSVLDPEATKGVDFDAFNWIASMGSGVKVCFAWGGSGIARLDDVKTRKLVIGASGRGAGNYFGDVLKTLYGDQIQVVLGYASNQDVWLAFERGETTANCTGWDIVTQMKSDWIEQRKINVLVQFAKKPIAGLEHAPLVYDLPLSEGMRATVAFLTLSDSVVRPYAAPPNTPSDRVEALRAAFARIVLDPQFIATARQTNLAVDFVDARQLGEIVQEIRRTPTAAVEMARRLNQ